MSEWRPKGRVWKQDNSQSGGSETPGEGEAVGRGESEGREREAGTDR